MDLEFDFVIIGAGSAGCVLANRLSADAGNSVLLLEAGGSDKGFWIQTPIGYGKTFYDPAVNWMYMTEPDPGIDNRQSYWPRGKMLGGSSSINAMVYIRGQAADYDDWRDLGNRGWGWDEVLPYFKKNGNRRRRRQSLPQRRRTALRRQCQPAASSLMPAVYCRRVTMRLRIQLRFQR